MIAYVTLGTNNFERAVQFYDALLGALGAARVMQSERMTVWGTSAAAPMLSVCKPFDGNPASNGNGTMVSIGVGSAAQVDALYKKAIELGGSDEGAPGPRGAEGGFYIGYFRDLDRNKLNFFYSP